MSVEAHPYGDWERPEMVPFVPEPATRILDVGCSTGSFGALLRRQRPDAEVWGVEPNEEAAAKAGERLTGVVCGRFPEAVEGQDFDCIVFNDVLEHMPDPWTALNEATSLLAPGGCVVASLPNVRNARVILNLAVRGRWTYEKTGILDRTHLRFFTRRSAIALFEESGYHVETAEMIALESHGKAHRLLSLLGHRVDEFRALQIAIRAVPR